MTIAMAWVSKRNDGLTHLYLASDSRTRGAMVFDFCPKILTLPRSDCAICFAGNTAATYPLMLQLANAIDSHLPAKNRALDIRTLKPHLLRVFTDIIKNINDKLDPITPSDVQFIFCGYSWLSQSFEIWTIYYSKAERKFEARPSVSFHELMPKVAFIGDVAKVARSRLMKRLNAFDETKNKHLEFEPLLVLKEMLTDSTRDASIGGAPQLVKISQHMNTTSIGILWPDADGNKQPTLMGRKIFDYENIDNVMLDLDTFAFQRPRSFGFREIDNTLESNSD